MNILKLYLGIMALSSSYPVLSQSLTGRVTDSCTIPISDVTVIIQTTDSLFVDAVFTDTLGVYYFNNIPDTNLRILFQHIMYHPYSKDIEVGTNKVEDIVLFEKESFLDEITITGERPIMKIENNIISYDAQLIAKDKTATNAYEILKAAPGVIISGNNPTLTGSDKLNIIINGQITTMTTDQITTLLKAMPGSRVQKIEIMYNPPAKYNVRGALINIVTTGQSDIAKIAGELGASYSQSVYASSKQWGSMVYTSSQFSADILATISSGKYWRQSDTYSKHMYNNNEVIVDETTSFRGNYADITFRLGSEYSINKDNKVRFSYYSEGENNNSNNASENLYTEYTNYIINSIERNKANSWLHNAYLQYSGKRDLNIGVEYTYYHDPNKGHYYDEKNSVPNTDFLNNSTQKISKWTLFANQTSKLTKDFSLNYGINGNYNVSNTDVAYLFPHNGSYVEDTDMRIRGEQEEHIINGYVESGYKFNNKLSTSISFKAEYFNADYTMNEIKNKLWNEWGFFPNGSITLKVSDRNTLQANFSSDKRYPSYWAVNPHTTNLSSYSQIVGNPQLKPSKTYRAQLLYIRDKKYIVMGFINYTPDYFTQLPYQSDNEAKLIYRYENFDYQLRTGLNLIIPFKIDKVWDARVTLMGFRTHEKMKHFHNTSFNNISFAGVIRISNSFLVSDNLKLELDGTHQSKARQGVYRLGEYFDLMAGVKWDFCKEAYVTFNYDNILLRSTPRPIKIDYENQYSRRADVEKSSFRMSLVLKLGNYKPKSYDEIDDGRLKR